MGEPLAPVLPGRGRLQEVWKVCSWAVSMGSCSEDDSGQEGSGKCVVLAF